MYTIDLKLYLSVNVYITVLKKIFIDDVLKFYSNQQSIYRNLKIITFNPFNYRENRVNRM